MHPREFEKVYIRIDYLEEELKKMLAQMNELNYGSLGDYDKGGFDGYKQAVTEMMKKISSKFSKLA
ncbi:MAG: hypothetical protein JJT78_03050 [Leptospira sp.]|nr:hypothetical protein [Leptospira sp.]